jgi:hypothetical protein
MACSVAHVLPLEEYSVWKCSQHTKLLGVHCRGPVVPRWTHSLVGENRSPYLGTSLVFPRIPACPTKNYFYSVPHQNCAMWPEKLGGYNFRMIIRISVSILHRIYLFATVGMSPVLVCCQSPSSRLLYFRVKSFHVCSLSTGKSHPRAQHIGIFNATNTWQYRIGSMRVCGDNFAVASEQGLYISVWNWKSGEHISDFVCSSFKIKWNPIHLTTSQTASLQASVFTFLDEYHILFPSSIDDGLYVYDIRAMPPITMRKQKLKGTHCFEITIPQFCDKGTVCSITLESNSLTTGSDAATGLFYTSHRDHMISLRFTVELSPRSMLASRGKDYREMHVHARCSCGHKHTQLLLMRVSPSRGPHGALPLRAWSRHAKMTTT